MNILPSQNNISIVCWLDLKTTSQAPDKRNFIVKFCRQESQDTKRDLLIGSKNPVKPIYSLYVNNSFTILFVLFSTLDLRQIKSLYPDWVRLKVNCLPTPRAQVPTPSFNCYCNSITWLPPHCGRLFSLTFVENLFSNKFV